jgi:flagellar hook assembly protein FlgD
VTAPADERWKLSLHDAAGRVLMRASGVSDGVPHSIRWDGQDARGAPAAPGVYWARLEAGNGQVVRQVLRLGRER